MAASVWIVEVAVTDAAGLRDLLDPAERDRADRKDDPRAYLTAHALQRVAISSVLGVAPSEVSFTRRCATCGSDRHGKPSTSSHPELAFSLSYTRTVAVIAISTDGEVGVDVEEIAEADFDGFARVTLAAEEAHALAELVAGDQLPARARLWSRKEAILKATGHGLVVDPTQVVVGAATVPPRLVRWDAEQPGPAVVAMADLVLRDPAHVGAVAVLAPGPLTVNPLPLPRPLGS